MRVITTMSGSVRSWNKEDVVPAGLFLQRELGILPCLVRMDRAPEIYPCLDQLRDNFAEMLGFRVVDGCLETPTALTDNALLIFKDAAAFLLEPGSAVEFAPVGDEADRKVVLDVYGVASMKYAQRRWVELVGVKELDVRGVLATDEAYATQRAIRKARRVALVVDGFEYRLADVEVEER